MYQQSIFHLKFIDRALVMGMCAGLQQQQQQPSVPVPSLAISDPRWFVAYERQQSPKVCYISPECSIITVYFLRVVKLCNVHIASRGYLMFVNPHSPPITNVVKMCTLSQPFIKISLSTWPFHSHQLLSLHLFSS